MSKKPAGKRRKTDSESLSSIINEINDITSAECSKSRKTRPTRPARSKATDIEIQRDETGQRIFHSRRLLSQSSWARGRGTILELIVIMKWVFLEFTVKSSYTRVLLHTCRQEWKKR
jgi:hypothetical protein